MDDNSAENSEPQLHTNDVGEEAIRKSYTLEFKEEAVSYSRKTSIVQAAKKYNVDRRCIQKWKKIYEQIVEELKNGRTKCKRIEGGGRPISDKDFDEQMINWIKIQRKEKMRVSRRSIKVHAELTRKDPTFKVSNGWMESFLRRHNYVSRRPTTICQKPPDEFVEKIVDFLLFVERMMNHHKYNYIYACDETAVYLDFSKTKTVELRGVKQVPVKTTGHDKLHVTVMLTARHDGFKCRPFVLLPNKRPIPEIIKKFGSKLELSWCGKTFFNDETTEQFLKTVIGTTLFGKRLLVWDAFRCHISTATKNVLKQINVHTATVPGGTTKYIQAPDVFWNAVFKSKIAQKYEDWMLHGTKTYTSGGNMRAPPMVEYLRWICEAWEALPVDLIKKSFKGCGINNAPGGSEDALIHCFKEYEEMQNGLELLKSRRNELDDSQDEEEQSDVPEDTEEFVFNEEDSDVELDFDAINF